MDKEAHRRALIWLVLSVLTAGTGVVQSQPPGNGNVEFAEFLNVEVVEVDAVVTDRRGRPVTGLPKEDFELYVDGERVEISNFFELGAFLKPAKPSTPGSSPPGSELPAEGPGPEVSDSRGPNQLTVALYLDEARLHGPHRQRLLRRLGEALEPWRRWNARFLLATFRNRLEILVPPASDLDQLIAAATSGERRPMPDALQQHVALKRMLHEIEDILRVSSPDAACLGPLPALARRHAVDGSRRTAVAASGLSDLVGLLAGMPGRKIIVYVSGSLPNQPGMPLFHFLAEKICSEVRGAASALQAEVQSYNQIRTLDAVTRYANASRVAFYSVDARGIEGGLAQDISLPYGLSLTQMDRDRRMNAQSGLFTLADETGGSLLANSNDFATLLADATERIEATYSLGFLHDGASNGRLRKLRVALAPHAAAGRKVQFRKNYRLKGLRERLSEQLLAAIYLGEPPNPLRAQIDFAKPKKLKTAWQLEVHVLVPADAVLLVPDREEIAGTVRLFMLAAEAEGQRRTAIREKFVAVGGPNGVEPENGFYWFNIRMELGRGNYVVAGADRDDVVGVDGLVGLTTSQFLNEFSDRRHPGGAADENDVVDLTFL